MLKEPAYRAELSYIYEFAFYPLNSFLFFAGMFNSSGCVVFHQRRSPSVKDCSVVIVPSVSIFQCITLSSPLSSFNHSCWAVVGLGSFVKVDRRMYIYTTIIDGGFLLASMCCPVFLLPLLTAVNCNDLAYISSHVLFCLSRPKHIHILVFAAYSKQARGKAIIFSMGFPLLNGKPAKIGPRCRTNELLRY